MAKKSLTQPGSTTQLLLVLLAGIVIGATVMAQIDKSMIAQRQTESFSNNDDVPSLEKDIQQLKSTNPFNN